MNEYGNDFITLEDDEGNEFELEHIGTQEINGQTYMAFLPADKEEDDEDYGLIILKVVEENGEELLSSVDDDDELDNAFEVFMSVLNDDDIDE